MYKRMDLNGIWKLFGFGDEKNDKKVSKELENFKKSPQFKLKMFAKMISQGVMFKKQLIDFFKNSDPEIEMDGIGEVGDLMMYNRAWFWVSECNPRKKEWKEALTEIASEDFKECIEVSIKYFEEIEEYEKCAHFKKILDFVEKVLKEKEDVIS